MPIDERATTIPIAEFVCVYIYIIAQFKCINMNAHLGNPALLSLARCKLLLMKLGFDLLAGDGAGTKLPHVILRYLMSSGMGQLNWLSYARPH